MGVEIARFKVHKIGRSLMVVIPKIWAEKTGIRQGQTVSIEVTRTGLLVKPLKGGENEQAT